MNDEIMSAFLERKRVFVRNDGRTGKPFGPEFGVSRDDGGVAKGPVNLVEPFLENIGRKRMEKQRIGAGGGRAPAMERERGAVGQGGRSGHGSADKERRVKMQSVLKVLYPPQCVTCDAMVEDAGALCADCWQRTPFLGGLACDACGAPLVGDAADDAPLCDQCLQLARPWDRGRAALAYRDNARRLVLALKHGDRLDLAVPAAKWMARAGAPIIREGMLAVPVPAHPWRLIRRRFNQAAVLARALSRLAPVDYVPDALVRIRRTRVQDGMGQEERFRNLSGAIEPHPRRADRLGGSRVLLIDDVMTSGATLAAATEAARAAGAREVCVLVLARVARDP